MNTTSAGNTDTGKTRKNNEDAFLIDDDAGLYAVADGIGGHEGGEVASRMAVEVLREALKDAAGKDATTADSAVSNLINAFQLANAKIRQASSREAHLSGMGTTLTALLLAGKTAHLAHVGDSRCYRLRAGSLEQVTEDHGVVAEQVRAGLITPDQAKKSPYRHIITRALGIDQDLLVDHRAVEVEENDVFLLCTDGLTEMVEDQLIMRILASNAPSEAVGRLILTANDHGGADNVTVVVVKIEKAGAGQEEHG